MGPLHWRWTMWDVPSIAIFSCILLPLLERSSGSWLISTVCPGFRPWFWDGRLAEPMCSLDLYFFSILLKYLPMEGLDIPVHYICTGNLCLIQC